jgi:hypothetical protein
MALTAGVLIVIAQLMMLPFDPDDHVATSTDPVFQIGGVVYLAGFAALLLALIGISGRIVQSSTRFGTVAVATAVVGTFLLGGDLWFETFAVPWLADEAPAALDTDPTMLLGIGAVASYVSFAAGWAMFGLATFRARVIPVALSAAIVIGGVLGFSALVAPLGIPLGIAIGSLGIWAIRSGSPTSASQKSAARASLAREPEPTPVI